MEEKRKVDLYDEDVNPITPLKRQVYGAWANGPGGTVTRMDPAMKDALDEIADYYGSPVSWVVRLAIKRFINYFERSTNVQVYRPPTNIIHRPYKRKSRSERDGYTEDSTLPGGPAGG